MGQKHSSSMKPLVQLHDVLTRHGSSCLMQHPLITRPMLRFRVQDTIATEFKERTILCIARKFQLGNSCLLSLTVC